jgi:hypothetical protein
MGMVSERDRRIARFRKVSGYLLWVSMPMLVLAGLAGFFFFILLICFPIGSSTLSDVIFFFVDGTLPNGGYPWQFKLIFVPLYSVLFGMCMYVLFHFQKLIECFFDGEVFNRTTITHARKAYRMNIYFGLLYFAIYASMVLFCVFSSTQGNAARLGNLFFSAIGCIIDIGFLSLVLWALEIGTDLNEDAELTI